jgi:hypothetical protein
MALGTNRDYKSNAQRVQRNLALYALIVKDLTDLGVDKDKAETQAGEMVLHPVAYFKPLAVVAVDDGVRETQFLSNLRYSGRKAARKAYRAAKAEEINA